MLPAIFSRFRLASCSARSVLFVNFVFHLPALRSWPSFCIFGWLVFCRVYYPVFFSWSDLSLIFFHFLTFFFFCFLGIVLFVFSLGFYSRFVLCVSLSFVTVIVVTVCLEFQIFYRGFQLFFFSSRFVDCRFVFCPISLVTLVIFLQSCNLLLQVFFFVIFHDFFWSFYIQVFPIETMWYFFL